MRNRGKDHHTTIIKRSSRKGHEEIHGGAWKVAFADFTLAMMALFMVLWIMGAVTEEERKEIVSLLNGGETIFEGHAISPITQKDVGGDLTIVGKRDPQKNTAEQKNSWRSRLSSRKISKTLTPVRTPRLRSWRASLCRSPPRMTRSPTLKWRLCRRGYASWFLTIGNGRCSSAAAPF